ncbi:hypothetical protein HELRODRAFT_62740, partial [Helobdella robusta]|uniref:Peptidase metallopeptidase domain-containing protein n=1 Tax=Helobdella robusta TaxID=6412 RepID=T1FX44_HELRO
KWYTSPLSYRFVNYPSRSSASSPDSSLAQAFNDWSSVAKIDFYQTSNQKANIQIGFYRGDHGDGDSFDGRGNVLAHAFFPQDGNLHFDDDESWSADSSGTNLRQVAAHEIGHIIGLGHTRDSKAVMYAYYTYRNNFQLQPDDVAGVRQIYGPYFVMLLLLLLTLLLWLLWLLLEVLLLLLWLLLEVLLLLLI